MGRSPCCEKVGLKKGPWTPEEDQKLLAYIEEHGHGSWRALPAKAGNVHGILCDLGLQRCGKSCRLRWTNYLRPDIKRGKFSLQEEQTIIQLHALLGNRWSAIATHLPKRTDNEIKNYWNTHLKKRLTKMGIDPVTHKPKRDSLGSSGQSKDAANLSHMAQWESARLEAEARLVRESKPVSSSNPYLSQAGLLNKSVIAPPPPTPPKMPPCLDVLKAWQSAWTKPPTRDATFAPNSFFNPNGTLESPTSTLNFSENIFNMPPLAFVENSSIGALNYVDINSGVSEMGMTKEEIMQNGWKYFGNHMNNFPEVKARTIENTMALHDDVAYPIDTTYIADTLRLPSYMESFTEELIPENGDHDHDHNMINTSEQQLQDDDDNNADESCGGDFEDQNKNYWNNILNLVTLQSGSPVF